MTALLQDNRISWQTVFCSCNIMYWSLAISTLTLDLFTFGIYFSYPGGAAIRHKYMKNVWRKTESRFVKGQSYLISFNIYLLYIYTKSILAYKCTRNNGCHLKLSFVFEISVQCCKMIVFIKSCLSVWNWICRRI